jgi:hypothetical protein
VCAPSFSSCDLWSRQSGHLALINEHIDNNMVDLVDVRGIVVGSVYGTGACGVSWHEQGVA